MSDINTTGATEVNDASVCCEGARDEFAARCGGGNATRKAKHIGGTVTKG